MKKLTEKQAIQEVEEIKELKHDNELAHVKEDELYLWFIECVAEGMYDDGEAPLIASILRSTQEINFERWHA